MSEVATDVQTGLISRVIDWFTTRLNPDEELACLSNGDIAGMAHDLGLAETDLRTLLPRAADNTLLMEAMMHARGLDAADVARLAGVMRDIELTCTRCGAVTRCRRELAAGSAELHCHEFCGNAETFDALLTEQART
jgi:hypothetical protein